jgi:RimJ/RimL family protein N-acetyltransferase
VFDKAGMTEAQLAPGQLSGAVSGMVGDVNLFLLPPGDEADDYAAAAGAHAAAQPPAEGSLAMAPPRSGVAELMVMLADPAARRRGLAQEAVHAMMAWGA